MNTCSALPDTLRLPAYPSPDSSLAGFSAFYTCLYLSQVKELLLKGLTQAEIAVNKKLAQWIDSHSIAQIFDWFDCIETTTIKTDAGICRWSTESVARDQKFLEMLKTI